ncbi:MAG: dihydropteroate synthase [Puniceicoccales bacterium]|jgi:dihydropteroate synthase|nr:dihydropteroate synthase [Puniceicoccales bacterium]
MGRNFNDVVLPCAMGILNVTPDSFSDGGKFFDGDCENSCTKLKAEARLNEIISEGASVVDIGGESTKPDAQSINAKDEWRRISHIVKIATKSDKVAVSVDTYHLETAQLALESGVNIVNDVCGTWHFEEMVKLLKNFDSHLIVTHNCRNDESFAGIFDPVAAIISEFEKIFLTAKAMKFDFSRIILDPGIGFGKTAQQNSEIFKRIGEICETFPNPVVCATSMKSFLQQVVGNSRAKLSAATIATTVEGFRRGCKIFRVHEILENLAALKFAEHTNG